jgi:hypothetical protein
VALIEQFDWMFSTQNFEQSVTFEKEDDFLNDTPITRRITYDDMYQRIEIQIFPTFFDLSLDRQRKVLLHEFVYTFTIPLNRIAYDLHAGNLYTPEHISRAHERATSKIENILDKLLRGGMRYAKQAYKEYLKDK